MESCFSRPVGQPSLFSGGAISLILTIDAGANIAGIPKALRFAIFHPLNLSVLGICRQKVVANHFLVSISCGDEKTVRLEMRKGKLTSSASPSGNLKDLPGFKNLEGLSLICYCTEWMIVLNVSG